MYDRQNLATPRPFPGSTSKLDYGKTGLCFFDVSRQYFFLQINAGGKKHKMPKKHNAIPDPDNMNAHTSQPQ